MQREEQAGSAADPFHRVGGRRSRSARSERRRGAGAPGSPDLEPQPRPDVGQPAIGHRVRLERETEGVRIAFGEVVPEGLPPSSRHPEARAVPVEVVDHLGAGAVAPDPGAEQVGRSGLKEEVRKGCRAGPQRDGTDSEPHRAGTLRAQVVVARSRACHEGLRETAWSLRHGVCGTSHQGRTSARAVGATVL